MNRQRPWRSRKHRVRRHARSTTGTAARSAPVPGPTPVHRESAPAWRSDPEVARSGAVVPVLKTLARNRRPIARHFIRAQLIRARRLSSLPTKAELRSAWTGGTPVPTRANETKGRLASPPAQNRPVLLRGEFFGLAFVPHEFERALGIFVGLRDFLLHLACRLFHFGRETHVPVIFHAGAGRNQAAHDHVLLQSAQMIDSSLNGSFGQHARCLLKGGS